LLSRVGEEEEEKVEEDDGKSSLRSRLSILSSTGSISVGFVDPEERLVPADLPTQTQARFEIKFFSILPSTTATSVFVTEAILQ